MIHSVGSVQGRKDPVSERQKQSLGIILTVDASIIFTQNVLFSLKSMSTFLLIANPQAIYISGIIVRFGVGSYFSVPVAAD